MTAMFTRPRLRFALVLLSFIVLVWLVFRDEVMGPVLVPLKTLTAQVTVALIHLAGMDAIREASSVYHPGGFAYEISRGCTGFVGAALLAVAIAAYPSGRRNRLVGVALCVPLFIGINITRLVHLFYIGVYQPKIFHLFHEVLWEGGMMLAVFGMWLLWVLWADRHRSVQTRQFHGLTGP
jgi:exosortase/archaeosortase family protein